jgi:hypothetical protein
MATMVAVSSFAGAAVVGLSAARSSLAPRRRVLVVRAQTEVSSHSCVHALDFQRVGPRILSMYLNLTACVSPAGNGPEHGDGERINLFPKSNLKPDPNPGSTQAQG